MLNKKIFAVVFALCGLNFTTAAQNIEGVGDYINDLYVNVCDCVIRGEYFIGEGDVRQFAKKIPASVVEEHDSSVDLYHLIYDVVAEYLGNYHDQITLQNLNLLRAIRICVAQSINANNVNIYDHDYMPYENLEERRDVGDDIIESVLVLVNASNANNPFDYEVSDEFDRIDEIITYVLEYKQLHPDENINNQNEGLKIYAKDKLIELIANNNSDNVANNNQIEPMQN